MYVMIVRREFIINTTLKNQRKYVIIRDVFIQKKRLATTSVAGKYKYRSLGEVSERSSFNNLKYIIRFFIYAVIVIMALYFIGNTTTATAEDKIDFKVYELGDSLTEKEVEKIISLYATGTKAYQMKRTVFCESGYKNIQSNIVKNGIREDSWGIAQINLYWNTNITKSQALDPYFSIKFMSDNWNTVKWYGLDRNTDTCNIVYK